MKLIILTILCFICICAGKDGKLEVPQSLLNAINMVEASGQKINVPIGDNGRSRGPFQIQKNYWIDSRVAGKWEDCEDYDYSVRVLNAYMNRYAKQDLINGNFEAIAKKHNGGPQGDKKKSTQKYWEKVKQHLK